MREKYADVFVELGFGFITETCGVSGRDFFNFMFGHKELPKKIITRLNFLAEVIECLAGTYKIGDGSIQKWFRRKRKQLGDFSPYQRMLLPGFWAPHSTDKRKILSLAESLRDGGAT